MDYRKARLEAKAACREFIRAVRRMQSLSDEEGEFARSAGRVTYEAEAILKDFDMMKFALSLPGGTPKPDYQDDI